MDFRNREIKPNTTLIEALKKMDSIGKKLLIVIDNNKFIGLLSIGDIQRAIIKNKQLSLNVTEVIRDNIKVGDENDTFESIKKTMFDFRMEFCPIISSRKEILKIYYWEDIFENDKPIIKKEFNNPVVIMAGGLGTRLKPITNVLPKPLIPIGVKTIFEEIYDRFALHGCNNFFVSINYKAELIKYYISLLSLNACIEFLEEEIPLGTAGSLGLLRSKIRETFFVTNCDILIDHDYSEIMDFHKENKNDVTIVTVIKNYEIPYGIIETSEAGGFYKLTEKPELTFKINSGMYLLEPHLLDLIPEKEFFHITHLIEKVKKSNGRVGIFPVSEKAWKDIGDLDEYVKSFINVRG